MNIFPSSTSIQRGVLQFIFKITDNVGQLYVDESSICEQGICRSLIDEETNYQKFINKVLLCENYYWIQKVQRSTTVEKSLS